MFRVGRTTEQAHGCAELLAVFFKDVVRDLTNEDAETLAWIWSEDFDWWSWLCNVEPDVARVALLRRAMRRRDGACARRLLTGSRTCGMLHEAAANNKRIKIV